MNLTPKFFAKIEKGKLKLNDQSQFMAYISGLKGDYELVLKKRFKQRSNKENRYYWGVVIPLLCEYMGYDNEEMHEAIKWKFLKKQTDLHPKHEELPTVRSTTTLSTIEFEQLMEEIKRWAAIEFEILIPDPNEVEI